MVCIILKFPLIGFTSSLPDGFHTGCANLLPGRANVYDSEMIIKHNSYNHWKTIMAVSKHRGMKLPLEKKFFLLIIRVIK